MTERNTIARHAATVLAGQLAVMAFGVTDTVVAGRYSEHALAALSVGSATFVSVYVGLTGMLQSMLPIWAQFHGANRPLELGRALRQTLYICLVGGLLGIWLLLNPGPLLRWAEVPLDLQQEVSRYLAVLALGLPPALLFRVYSTLNQGLGRPRLVTWVQLGSLALKIPLSIWFTFGGWGLQAQGAVGCAWATVLVNYGMLMLAIFNLRTQPLYRPYALWQKLEAPDRQQLGPLLRLGLPGGLSIMVEVTSFTLMALFIARLGSVASAGHQIAANVGAVLYMVPLSLGIATSARVSYWRGAGQPDLAKLALRSGFWLAGGCALVLAGTMWLARVPLAEAYSRSPAVVLTASSLLAWVALYHLADAIQAVAVFVLRSYGITLWPLLVYSVMLWGVGLLGGFALAYHGIGAWPAMQKPEAFWAASAAALAATAIIFAITLARAVRRDEAISAA
ncbi:MATE family efflux transporter [Variovorax sp. HJSM1_2]|uniref:MATE family efflux transporter n=1 Tax=Variovorax sp. HJSM1_2 TaxID=3366263 RepID=UPI003BC90E4E